MESPRPPLRLVVANVVCAAWIGQTIDIRLVALCLSGRLGLFPACVSTCRLPEWVVKEGTYQGGTCTIAKSASALSVTNMIFQSGELICTGATTEQEALLAMHMITSRIRRDLGIDVAIYGFSVCNYVSYIKLGCELNLELFAYDHPLDSQYQPASFPGAHFYPKDCIAAFVLFKSGKVLVLGLPNLDKVPEVEVFLTDMYKYAVGKEYKQLPAGYRLPRRRPDSSTKKKKKTKKIKQEQA